MFALESAGTQCLNLLTLWLRQKFCSLIFIKFGLCDTKSDVSGAQIKEQIHTHINNQKVELAQSLTNAFIFGRICLLIQLQLCFNVLSGEGDADLYSSCYPT